MLGTTDQLRIMAFLKDFGCNSRESLAYIEALKIGTTTVQELSRRLKRNRITVYYTVQQLMNKGLLFETRKGKKKYISPENPDILSRIIEQRHGELKRMELNLEHIKKLLNSIETKRNEETIIKVYDDIDGFKKMLEETLQAENELLVFSSSGILSKILGEEYFENYFIRRAENGIHSRIIYPPGAFAEKLHAKKDQYKIDMRIIPQDERSGSGFYLWNNTIAIKSIKENKRSCTIIENRDIAHFFRNNIFNHFWDEAQPF